MISCSEAVRQLWDYLDNDVSPEDRANVDAHLARCRRCCGEAGFAAALRELLHSTESPTLPPQIETHLVGFLEALELQGGTP